MNAKPYFGIGLKLKRRKKYGIPIEIIRNPEPIIESTKMKSICLLQGIFSQWKFAT